VPLESGSFDIAAKQAAANVSLGNLPVVAISATRPPQEDQQPGELAKNRTKIFAGLHKKLAALSSRGQHVQIKTANHMSLVADKEQVTKILPHIRDVITEAAQ
jgi:hypothetical protein